jgi:hypothetical protein
MQQFDTIWLYGFIHPYKNEKVANAITCNQIGGSSFCDICLWIDQLFKNMWSNNVGLDK